jgi:hypothetical protein
MRLPIGRSRLGDRHQQRVGNESGSSQRTHQRVDNKPGAEDRSKAQLSAAAMRAREKRLSRGATVGPGTSHPRTHLQSSRCGTATPACPSSP